MHRNRFGRLGALAGGAGVREEIVLVASGKWPVILLRAAAEHPRTSPAMRFVSPVEQPQL